MLIANGIASTLQPSVYDSIILLKGLSYLPDLKPNKFYNLYATDIMETQLDFISYQSTYHELNDLLHNTNNESYPLVDAPGKIAFWGWMPQVRQPFRGGHTAFLGGYPR